MRNRSRGHSLRSIGARMAMRAVVCCAVAACAGRGTGEFVQTPPPPADDGCAMDVRRLFADELALRPAAEPADLYLLLHEALLPGDTPRGEVDEAAFAALEPAAGVPIVEDLDEVRGTVRLNLRKWRFIRGTAAELAEVVTRSAREPPGDRARLAACSEVAPQALQDLGRDGAALAAYLRRRAEEAWPLVEHSEKYKNDYQPAYRVVFRRHLPPWVTAPPPGTG